MRVYCALIFLTSFYINNVASQCQFPSDLTGLWYSSTKGLLNITTDSTTTYIASYNTLKFGDFDLSCNTSTGNYYIFQGPIFDYLNNNFQAFFCFYLSNAASSTKYIYHLGSDINVDALNERMKTPLTSIGFVPSYATVCDRATYETGSENIFLKNDGSEADNRIDFPFDMRGTWSYSFTSGTTTTCSTNSSANICSASDYKTITFDYGLCTTIQSYSASGVLYNVWSTSDSSYTYYFLFNADSSTDESTTYRFTCYVVSIASSTGFYASQHPQSCLSGQTPTNVTSPGATLVFIQTAYDTSSSVISTASAVGITLGVFFIIIIIVCGVLIWYYYKKRKERQAIDKLPLQKAQPANKKLTNGDLFRDSKSRASRMRDSRTPATMNGDVKINLDSDPGVRRENSICISMTSRGGSGMGLEDRIGPAPVEEPEKLPKSTQHETTASGNKYLVDIQRDEKLRSANKRAVQASAGASAGENRRRFGDPIPESARANRKRTPRIRHPMEIQETGEDNKEKSEGLKKTEGFWRDEKVRRSGRSRQHPEARTIPSVKEDPLDHREKTPPPSVPPTRSGRSALRSGFERENSAFIDPVGGTPVGDEIWSKASNMWHFKNQPTWGNLGLHHK